MLCIWLADFWVTDKSWIVIVFINIFNVTAFSVIRRLSAATAVSFGYGLIYIEPIACVNLTYVIRFKAEKLAFIQNLFIPRKSSTMLCHSRWNFQQQHRLLHEFVSNRFSRLILSRCFRFFCEQKIGIEFGIITSEWMIIMRIQWICAVDTSEHPPFTDEIVILSQVSWIFFDILDVDHGQWCNVGTISLYRKNTICSLLHHSLMTGQYFQ